MPKQVGGYLGGCMLIFFYLSSNMYIHSMFVRKVAISLDPTAFLNDLIMCVCIVGKLNVF